MVDTSSASSRPADRPGDQLSSFGSFVGSSPTSSSEPKMSWCSRRSGSLASRGAARRSSQRSRPRSARPARVDDSRSEPLRRGYAKPDRLASDCRPARKGRPLDSAGATGGPPHALSRHSGHIRPAEPSQGRLAMRVSNAPTGFERLEALFHFLSHSEIQRTPSGNWLDKETRRFQRVSVMGGTGLEPVTPSLSSWCSPN